MTTAMATTTRVKHKWNVAPPPPPPPLPLGAAAAPPLYSAHSTMESSAYPSLADSFTMYTLAPPEPEPPLSQQQQQQQRQQPHAPLYPSLADTTEANSSLSSAMRENYFRTTAPAAAAAYAATAATKPLVDTDAGWASLSDLTPEQRTRVRQLIQRIERSHPNGASSSSSAAAAAQFGVVNAQDEVEWWSPGAISTAVTSAAATSLSSPSASVVATSSSSSSSLLRPATTTTATTTDERHDKLVSVHDDLLADCEQFVLIDHEDVADAISHFVTHVICDHVERNRAKIAVAAAASAAPSNRSGGGGGSSNSTSYAGYATTGLTSYFSRNPSRSNTTTSLDVAVDDDDEADFSTVRKPAVRLNEYVPPPQELRSIVSKSLIDTPNANPPSLLGDVIFYGHRAYVVYSWSSTFYTLYKNPWLVRLTTAALMRVAQSLVVLLL